MVFYPKILRPKQKKVLAGLTFLNGFPFYLAGGTALALQLGHRTSLDFDFYSPEKFKNQQVARAFKKQFLNIFLGKEQLENTWQGKVLGTNISVFYYPYKLIGPLIDFSPVKLASYEDIAAMKIVAIIQRAKQRDFFDLYYLIKKIGLTKIITATYKKYPWYEENDQIIFKALTFFEEADQDEEIKRIAIFDKALNWEKVKKEITIQVKRFMAS
ncbi:MAG: nucleotidyl transferase AbiEii/AbiGii toxin family protein [Patescibacteria group bacterium]|nr:nucleotidyl transferase AbiEii/AbiGii toxin family protein [Patescibacteria group bacterium]